MKLLLALSGGGFRATIFHLGVIRFLRDSGLLKQVAAVSSVSGGSITAAHLVLNWRDYTGPLNDFLKQQEKIRSLTQFGLRNRLFRRDLIYTLRNLFRRKDKYTITDRLRDYYEQELFSKNDTLASLRTAVNTHNAPKLFLMTTTLTRPTAVCYFEPGQFVLRDAISQHSVGLDGYPVAAAVAASSAFPLLFPPLRISAEECRVYQLAFGLPAQYLTDGGVFENLGITVLRDYASTAFPSLPEPAGHVPCASEPYFIVLSNAGAKLDWDLDTRFTQKRFRSILRSVEIVQYWAEQRLQLNPAPRELMIDIADTVDPALAPGFPSRETQQQAARIRTDLDTFSNLERQVLYDHGYSVARKALQLILDQYPPPAVQPPPEPPYSPWQGVADTPAAERRIQGPLTAARRRRWRPWVGMDRYSVLYGVLILIFVGGLYFGWPFVWKMGESIVAYLSEQSRKDLGSKTIEFFEPQDAGIGTDLQHPGLTREARIAVKRTCEQLAERLPEGWQLLLIEQDGTFEHDYRTQTRWLRFKGNAQAVAGVAYLIDATPGVNDIGYREVRMPKTEPERRRLVGSVEIERPKKNEFLVFVLIVEANVLDDPKRPFPGKNVSKYQFNLDWR